VREVSSAAGLNFVLQTSTLDSHQNFTSKTTKIMDVNSRHLT